MLKTAFSFCLIWKLIWITLTLKDGWPKLRQFLGLPAKDGDEFPHENKGASAVNFVSNLWSGTEYETKVNTEVAAYMKQNGYECKKAEPKAE